VFPIFLKGEQNLVLHNFLQRYLCQIMLCCLSPTPQSFFALHAAVPCGQFLRIASCVCVCVCVQEQELNSLVTSREGDIIDTVVLNCGPESHVMGHVMGPSQEIRPLMCHDGHEL
jgi:hypothetical protein